MIFSKIVTSLLNQFINPYQADPIFFYEICFTGFLDSKTDIINNIFEKKTLGGDFTQENACVSLN